MALNANILLYEDVLLSIAFEMSPEEIEQKSRVQQRGRFRTPHAVDLRKEP